MKNFFIVIQFFMFSTIFSQTKNSFYDFSMISNQSSNYYYFENACVYCDTLTEGGFNDWILPSTDEWAFLMNGGAFFQQRTSTWLMLRNSEYTAELSFRRVWGNTFGDIYMSGSNTGCTVPGNYNSCPQYVRCIR